MYLFSPKRYYALNDRTINLLLKGDIVMSATNSETADVITDSDKEVVDLVNVEKEVGLFIVEKIRQEQVAHSFHILILPYLIYLSMAFFKTVDRNNYKHNCLYIALQAGGLSDVKLQELILSLIVTFINAI